MLSCLIEWQINFQDILSSTNTDSKHKLYDMRVIPMPKNSRGPSHPLPYVLDMCWFFCRFIIATRLKTIQTYTTVVRYIFQDASLLEGFKVCSPVCLSRTQDSNGRWWICHLEPQSKIRSSCCAL